MNKVLRFIAWCFVGIVLLLTAALVAVSIWAATGTRDLSKYNQFIQNSINQALVGNKIILGKTYLEWNHIDELLSIKAEKVELYDKSDSQIASFPTIVLKYNILSLLTGSLIPSDLYLVAPVVDLSNLTHEENDKGLDFQDFNLGKLDEINIINGILITPDSSQWKIANATLTYNDNIILDAFIQRDDGQQIIASLQTDAKQTDSVMKMQFRNLDSNSLLQFVPELRNIRFIANGSAVYSHNSKGKNINFKVDEMVGEINDPQIFNEKIIIKAGRAEGGYDINNEILDIKNVETVFDDDFRFSGNALITNFNTFVANLNFGNLQITNFRKYWPIIAAPNAITWIKEHMTAGVVTEGKLKLKLSAAEVNTGILAPDAITVNFAFKDVASSYLPNLPVISQGVGTGTMNGTEVRLKVSSAIAGNSKITRALVDFTGFDQPDVYLSVDADIAGDVVDVADFYLELGSGKKLLGSRDNLTGQATGNIKLSLPLLAALKISEVKYNVKTSITNATVKNLLDSFDASKATINVVADQNSYSVNGECYATYNKPGGFTLVNAPISFEVQGKGAVLRIAVASDITNSSAEFVPLGIKKNAGEKGKFLVEIVDNGQVPSLNKVMLDSDAVRLNAKGTLKKDYSDFSSLEVAAQFGKTDLVGKVSNNKALAIDLKGSYLDASPIIQYLKNDKDDSEDDTEFKLRLKADEIGLMNGQKLKDAYVTLNCAKDCSVISLNSQKVSFTQTNANLVVKASNAGNLLKGFDIYPNMDGGEISINAKVDGGNYDGRIIIEDFRISKAQILAKMLTLGSLTGIADVVRGKGISFKKLASEFKYTKEKITVKDFRMVGAAIGITANGEVNRNDNLADLSGNIIPAYTANTLLGKIPLIGDVIIGNDGVFALAYSLKGNMDDPSLSVNPLSVLAPGFLKNIFQ